MSDTKLSNGQIIEMLKEVLAAMEIKNVNRFKIRAYQNAIAVLENLTSSVHDIWEDGRLDDIPGVGEALSKHINDLFTRGVVNDWNAVKEGLPEGMFELIGLRGIGAKKAYKLAHAFNLTDRTTAIEKLKEHAQKGDIRVLDGFGEKSEKEILEALDQKKMNKNEKQRMLLSRAEEIVNRIKDWMEKIDSVEKIDALGSFRRRNPTVGDLDIVVATKNPEEVIKHFLEFPEIGEVVMKGDLKAIVVLTTDVQVDLRVTPPDEYGAMVQYNTGSKQHNIILRTYALEKGMSLSEYGIKIDGKILKFATEEKFYQKLGLPYIAPELRNGTNEIDLARRDKLPYLVELKDIKGDMQNHTIFSDGVNTMEEMVNAAEELGYEYIGFTDHSPSVGSRGYKEVERLIAQQRELVEKINRKKDKIKVFLGMEVNILADNILALPDELLKELDFVEASIHTAFNQDRKQLTDRYIMAIENPYVTFLGHPLGRLINERDAMDVDWRKVIDALASNEKMVEINSQPNRLDFPDDLARMAMEKGIKILINTDSHSINNLPLMKYGVDVARRAFCSKEAIANTLSYTEFVKLIKKH